MSRVHHYKGYKISRGDYLETPDNRLDCWYVEPEASTCRLPTRRGYSTIAEAKSAIDGHEL